MGVTSTCPWKLGVFLLPSLGTVRLRIVRSTGLVPMIREYTICVACQQLVKIVLAISDRGVYFGHRRFSMFRRIKKFLSEVSPEAYAVMAIPAFLLVYSVAFVFCFPEPLTKRAALLESGKRVVKLVNPATHSGGGTGFAVRAASGKSYTLTNAHICEIAEHGELHAVPNNYSGRYVTLRVIEISNDSDLCVLENMPNYSGFSLSDQLVRGQEVTIVGHPHLEPTTVAVGQVNAFHDVTISIGENMPPAECSKRGGMTQEIDDFFAKLFGLESVCLKTYFSARTDAVIYPGNSGSPALDSSGEVVGVLFAGSRETHWGYLVPLADIKRFLSIY